MLVHTIKGDIEHDQLRAVDRIWFEGNARNIHTQWFLGDEVVREDGVAQVLRALDMSGQQAAM